MASTSGYRNFKANTVSQIAEDRLDYSYVDRADAIPSAYRFQGSEVKYPDELPRRPLFKETSQNLPVIPKKINAIRRKEL